MTPLHASIVFHTQVGKKIFVILSAVYFTVLVGILSQTVTWQSPYSWQTFIVMAFLIIIYLLQGHVLIAPPKNPVVTSIIMVISGVMMGSLGYLTNIAAHRWLYILIIASLLVITVFFQRTTAYLFLAAVMTIHLSSYFIFDANKLPNYVPIILTVASVASIETVSVLARAYETQVKQLTIINRYAYRIANSLDFQEIVRSIDTAIREAIPADTYFLGLVENERIHFYLFFDENEYFSDEEAPLNSTLAGWIIRHQQALYLPDLRQGINLEGVQHYIIGKQKSNLSWMGVPLHTASTDGVLVLGSYSANKFSETDFQLLQNLGLHTSQTMTHALQHRQIQQQAQLDSLTQAYNHGSFITVAEKALQRAQKRGQPVSLIMLDIDHFKEYNDQYGHLAGDKILIQLVTLIKGSIKKEDVVGRWGGEEFAILLDNVNCQQALKIAQRIGDAIKNTPLTLDNGTVIPSPTVSQGIAIFPPDASNVMALIEVADKRLYDAKSHGRDRIIKPDTAELKGL